MKTYEKPVLNTFSLSGNDALCACTFDAVGDNMSPQIRQMLEFYLTQEQLQDDKYMKNLFANAADNCSNHVPELDGYCKFGPSGQIVFNS